MTIRSIALFMLFLPGAAAADCVARDFLAEPVSGGADPVAAALEAAYPGLDVSAGQIVTESGAVPYAAARGLQGAAALEDATVGDQFAQVYPLDFDLNQRLTPWVDPGRARNEALFRALWFDSESATRATLVRVDWPPTRASFLMTDKHCVATQLAAALGALVADRALDVWFSDVGGSFAWRQIAGTDRLSAHSFGTALDLNPQLGGYWRWSGATEGAVGPWDNQMPQVIVEELERRGFIWGGKWHHFDGMHFEYRPELILYARIVGG